MELPIHVEPPSRRVPFRWIPSARAVALLTLGVGIGVLAAIPLGGGSALPTVVAIAAAAVAVGLVVLVPNNAAAVATADVLLGVAVIASVFGRLGPLYIPLLLGFFAVTARVERPTRHAGARLRWSPAPEFEDLARPWIAAPITRQAESVWLPPFEPRVVGSNDLSEPAWLPADAPDRPAWLPPGPARPEWLVAGDFTITASGDAGDPAPSPDDAPIEPEPVRTAGHQVGPAIFAGAWVAAGRRGPAHRIGPAAVTLPRPLRVAPAPTHRIGPAAVTRPRPAVVAEPTATERRVAAPPVTEPPAAAAVGAAAATARQRRKPGPGPILPRRMVSAAVRARRVLGDHARIGFGNLRDALVEAPQIDVLLPPRPSENGDAKPPGHRVVVLPASELVDLRRELGDRELDVVGAGRITLTDAPPATRSRAGARARRPRPHGVNGRDGAA